MKQQSTGLQRARETAPPKFVTVDEILDRMKQVYDSIAHRAFEIFESHGQMFRRDLADWLQAESELLHPIHLDVAETENTLTVRAEVPGFSAKEIEISLEPHRLTIAGKRESKEERKTGKIIYYRERCSDQVFRMLELPVEVDAAKVTATLKDDVLELEMPKAAAAKKVRIEPKTT